jgi:hypothetical protein
VSLQICVFVSFIFSTTARLMKVFPSTGFVFVVFGWNVSQGLYCDKFTV